MKKKILLLTAVAICAAILASGTLAYFTSEDQVHNVITSGGVDMEIEEWQKTEEGLTPYLEEPIKVMPSVTVSKIVTIKNLEAASYIRADFEIIVKDSAGEVMELSEETIDTIISININQENWICKEGDEEWWYYDGSVETDVSTEPFFTEVVFNGPNMTNEYQNCTVEIIVEAQAVQAANNGSTVLEAKGWPEN